MIIKLSRIHKALTPAIHHLLLRNNFNRMSLAKKKSQIILHSTSEVEKMHIKKQTKSNQWETIRQGKANQFKVSLIGLPNSGKSTLFNCLVGEQLAIVDKQAGMTRDRRQYNIMDGLVKVIDTPGVEVSLLTKNSESNAIKQDIFKQTITAVHESDLIIVVVDMKKGISTEEMQMIKYLRKFKTNQKIILACNKAERIFDQTLIFDEMGKLSIDNMFMCSGIEGTGIFQILDYINALVPQQAKDSMQNLKRQRIDKFELLIKRLKKEMKQLETDKGINIKEWEHDFRKINPTPHLNQDLDNQNFQDFLIKPEQSFASKRGTEIKNLKMKNTIKICFIGRPNVGKSSLINQVLGEERMVVSETANTTRDSITTKILFKNRKIQLIDTAGLDNHDPERTQEAYLKKVHYSTMLHVKQSHVVVYVMDALSAFKIQDFKLIREAIDQGRPILIAVNKWEVIKQEYRYKARNYLMKQIDKNLGHTVHGHPIVFVSAKMNEGIDTMLDNIINAYDKWNSRISTGMLNDWLQKFKKRDNLPKDNEMTLKINYLIQARVRPPHFIFFVNNKKLFKENYMRFITQNIADEFKMEGIPLRLSLRSTNNKENEEKQKNKSEKQKKVSSTKIKMDELKKKYDNFGL